MGGVYETSIYRCHNCTCFRLKLTVRLHGIPASMVSDKDRVFINSFWRTLFQLQGTKLCIVSITILKPTDEQR
jgi:hypothetical protein